MKKGQKFTKEQIETSRKAHLGQIAWNKNLKMSDEFRIRLANSRKNIVYGMKGKKHTEETKRKISLSLMGHPVSKETLEKIKVGRRLSNRVISEETRRKIRTARARQVLPLKDTKIEVKLQNELKQRRIPFETHKPIYGLPDLFIKPNICVFADGDYWHNFEKARLHDTKVNDILRKNKYLVLRYWEHEIHANPDGCVDEIEDVINLRGEEK